MSITSKIETPLEIHRKEFIRLNGVGPMIRVDDLSQEEIGLINADFLERCRGRADDINAIYTTYVQTLHSWGVICPHPIPHRAYEGFHRTDVPLRFEEARWFDCRLCGAAVINR